jgi:hypothetical protein
MQSGEKLAHTSIHVENLLDARQISPSELKSIIEKLSETEYVFI